MLLVIPRKPLDEMGRRHYSHPRAASADIVGWPMRDSLIISVCIVLVPMFMGVIGAPLFFFRRRLLHP